MSIKNTLAGMVERRGSGAPADEIDRRLAPYTVTETTIRIPRQRQGGSTANADSASTD